MQTSKRLRVWRVIARRHPSAFLLAAQLLSLLLYPLMDETPSGRLLFGAVAVVVRVRGTVQLTLSTFGPLGRFTPAFRAAAVPRLHASATEIARRL